MKLTNIARKVSESLQNATNHYSMMYTINMLKMMGMCLELHKEKHSDDAIHALEANIKLLKSTVLAR